VDRGAAELNVLSQDASKFPAEMRTRLGLLTCEEKSRFMLLAVARKFDVTDGDVRHIVSGVVTLRIFGHDVIGIGDIAVRVIRYGRKFSEKGRLRLKLGALLLA